MIKQFPSCVHFMKKERELRENYVAKQRENRKRVKLKKKNATREYHYVQSLTKKGKERQNNN